MLHRQVRLLALFRFCNALRFGGAFMVLYFAGIAGSYGLAMSVFSITSLVQLLTDIPLGFLSDRAGRRLTLVLGAFVSLAYTLTYAASQTYTALAVAAALEGLAQSLFSGTEVALLYDTLAEEDAADRYATYSGRITAARPAAFAVAALVGGAVAAVWSLRVALWLTLAPQTVALGASLLLHEPRGHLHEVRPSIRVAVRPFLHSARLQLLVGAAAWRAAWSESSYRFRLAFLQTLWPLWAIGTLQALANGVESITFYASGAVIRRFGSGPALVVDIVCGRVLNVSALLFPSVVSPLLMALTSLTVGVGAVASDTLQQQEFTDRERATMGSISSQVVQLAFGAGAVALGVLADAVGIVHALIVTQLLVLLTLVPYRLLFAHHKHNAASSVTD